MHSRPCLLAVETKVITIRRSTRGGTGIHLFADEIATENVTPAVWGTTFVISVSAVLFIAYGDPHHKSVTQGQVELRSLSK